MRKRRGREGRGEREEKKRNGGKRRGIEGRGQGEREKKEKKKTKHAGV